MRKLAGWILAGVVVATGVAGLWFDRVGATGWRTDGSGVYPDVKVPAEWGSDKNVLWKAPLPNWSNAIPVIVGDRMLVEAEKDQLLCLSTVDGKVLWQVSNGYDQADIKPTWKVQSHDTNGFTSPTPMCDGKNVVMMNGYGVGAGYDLAGKRKWIRLIGTPAGGWGNSSSGILVDGIAVLLLNGNAYGIDAETGKELWKTGSASHWGSLIATKIGGEAVAITPDGDFLRVKDGKKLAKGSALEYNAPVVADGVVYFMCGEKGCKAFKLPARIEGDALKLEKLWESGISKKERTYSSPVVWDGLVYVITRYEQLYALDAKTGQTLWEQAMKVGGGVYPSLVLAGTPDGPRLLVSGASGTTAVLVPGKEYKEVGRNKLEGFRTSPVCVKAAPGAAGGDRLYIRGMKNLWCFGEKK